MENTETVAPTTSPAPVADKAPVTTPAAPVVATTETVAKPAGENKPDPKIVAREAFKSREEKREKKASEENAELRKRLAELEAKSQATPEPKELPVSLLDDPEKWAEKVRADATTGALAEFERRQSEAQAAAQYRQQAEGAASWLLTRSHLKEDQALVSEVGKVIEAKYDQVAAVNPEAAARLAYLDVCAAKGISADMDGFKPAGFNGTNGQATAGVKASAAPAGKRTFVRGEGLKYINEATPGTDDYSRRIQEVEEAKREGRFK